MRVRPDEAACIQRVRFPPRQGLASQRESSLALCEVTSRAKRRQSDRQALTQVKRLSPVRKIEQMPTGSSFGKATVGAGCMATALENLPGRRAGHAGKRTHDGTGES